MKKYGLIVILGLLIVAPCAFAQGSACKDATRRTYEEVFKGNIELASELFSDDAIHHDPGAPEGLWPPGGAGLATTIAEVYLTAFPDLEFKVLKQYQEGETVTTQWLATGTNTGSFMGMEPTGLPISVAGINIGRCEAGKIVENWSVYDLFGMFVQLGIIPAPGATSE